MPGTINQSAGIGPRIPDVASHGSLGRRDVLLTSGLLSSTMETVALYPEKTLVYVSDISRFMNGDNLM